MRTYLLISVFCMICLHQIIGQKPSQDSFELSRVLVTTKQEGTSQLSDSLVLDSAIFYYESIKLEVTTSRITFPITQDSIGSYFIKNDTKVFVFNNQTATDSLLAMNIKNNIISELKGTGPKGLYYNDPGDMIIVNLLVDEKGNIVEKSMSSFYREYPKMKKKFRRLKLSLEPWVLGGEPKAVLYTFVFSPYDI